MSGQLQTSRRKAKIVGSLSYNDPTANISFNSSKITGLTFNGNQAHMTGTGRIGKSRINFIVDAVDNGDPGAQDTFSIQLGSYSASGQLTSGNIVVR
jgi:hypothetical protein